MKNKIITRYSELDIRGENDKEISIAGMTGDYIAQEKWG